MYVIMLLLPHYILILKLQRGHDGQWLHRGEFGNAEL